MAADKLHSRANTGSGMILIWIFINTLSEICMTALENQSRPSLSVLEGRDRQEERNLTFMMSGSVALIQIQINMGTEREMRLHQKTLALLHMPPALSLICPLQKNTNKTTQRGVGGGVDREAVWCESHSERPNTTHTKHTLSQHVAPLSGKNT